MNKSSVAFLPLIFSGLYVCKFFLFSLLDLTLPPEQFPLCWLSLYPWGFHFDVAPFSCKVSFFAATFFFFFGGPPSAGKILSSFLAQISGPKDLLPSLKWHAAAHS